MSLAKTYELVSGPLAEPFEAYAARLEVEFAALIDTDPDEPTVHRFLERHPSLVPGMRSLGVLPSAFPFHSVLISEPVLPAVGLRRPDFMWLSYTSLGFYPTLIEIERPGKRLFTIGGVPSAEFTQARHQLAQWRAWFGRPDATQTFRIEYGARAVGIDDAFEPRFVLVYGRRDECQSDAELARERACLLDRTCEHLTSYDRLRPDPVLRNTIVVRPSGRGRFRAIAVPPTFTLGPVDANRLLFIDELEQAISDSASIPAERREFLLRRLPYWIAWARVGSRGFVSSGDCE